MALGLMLLLAACASPPEPELTQAETNPEPVAETVAEEVEEAAEVAESETEMEMEMDEGEAVVEAEEPAPARVVDTSRYDEFEIITLLPQDAIPAIDNPIFHAADEADDYYEPDELVMGVVFNGDARAYSVPHLSRHEIVNDEVGGVKIAVTW